MIVLMPVVAFGTNTIVSGGALTKFEMAEMADARSFGYSYRIR